MFHSHQISLHHKFPEKLSAFILSYISDFCYSVYLVMSFGSNSSQVRVANNFCGIQSLDFNPSFSISVFLV